MTFQPLVRALHPGMGQAVAERTILRPRLHPDMYPQVEAAMVDAQFPLNPTDKNLSSWTAALENAGYSIVLDAAAPVTDAKPKIEWETWGEVAFRVAIGNVNLVDSKSPGEFQRLKHHIAKATLLMSGRHLQHGDYHQKKRNLEVFTNCSTAATSSILFYLLLNGSGVGGSYDNDVRLVDWDWAPNLRVVLDETHPDFYPKHFEDVARIGYEARRDAIHKYGEPGSSKRVIWHEVEDSREGWAKAVEIYETMAFEKVHGHKTLILDFSKVRPKGAPIRGMQNRPSSGPVPLMMALQRVATIKGAGLDPWHQALIIDHYLAECVLVGGARRAARMATKSWRDPNVFGFIEVKRPPEYRGLSVDEVVAYRAKHKAEKGGEPLSMLYSSNNSVTTDAEFWSYVNCPDATGPLADHARKVFKRIVECSWGDGTGEPGIINVDQLMENREGLKGMHLGDFVGSKKYQVEDDTQVLLAKIAKRAVRKAHIMITNPCGEIALFLMGGYCVIADWVPYHADTFAEAIDAVGAAVRALIRTNTMDSLYRREVERTNRIGVGPTGIHEFAWKFFEAGFRSLIKPDFDALNVAYGKGDFVVACRDADPRVRAAAFWNFMRTASHEAVRAADEYADELGVTRPHTVTTVKPAGTTSKLFGLCEGWHLPAMAQYLRFVQFRNDDPLVEEYASKGYPTKQLVKYQGTTIVGFPTQPAIGALNLGDELVLAGEATPEEQYKWLHLGQNFWIDGRDENGENGHGRGNQISYTLKYDPKTVSLADFAETIKTQQSKVRACSVMPQEESASYEYLPETPLTKQEFEAIASAITDTMKEDIDRAHLACGTGGCPIDFDEGDKKETTA